MTLPRDHGGGLDFARAQFGGRPSDWLDLSTGINPVPYPLPEIPADAWVRLPDRDATRDLEAAARKFWRVPEDAAVLAAPGASALISRIPYLSQPGTVRIPGPTYNEHAAAFAAAGWKLVNGPAEACVIVHPNNPDGRLWSTPPDTALSVIDESFCDVAQGHSLIEHAVRPGTVILKSFGKFWGLAGLRLGFAIGDREHLAALSEALGPWPVSGPAIAIGRAALADLSWAEEARARLAADADRLDVLMARHASAVGGTALFRLYDANDAAALHRRLAREHVWSRVFRYSARWLRLGIPAPDRWDQIEAAL